MDAALNMLRIVRFAILGAIVLYAALCYRVSVSIAPRPVIFQLLALISVIDVLLVFFFRRKMVLRSEPLLASEPYDAALLARWRGGYIAIWALSLSIALYGLVLRFLGFAFKQISLFLIAGAVLIILFPARRPAPSR